MSASLSIGLFVSQAIAFPFQQMCESFSDDNCTNPATYGLEGSFSIAETVPTDQQLEPLLEKHRPSSRRADKISINPIDSIDSLDWLITLGQDNEVILIGENHWLEVTAAIEVTMIKALIERADYRQVVLEYPYSMTPLLNAYVNIQSDQAAFEFFHRHLLDCIHFPAIIALLNVIRDFNIRHSDSPISILTTDVEHTLYSAASADAVIAVLREEYSALTDEQFPEMDREPFFTQVKRNYEGTTVYYETNNVMDTTRQDMIEGNLTGLYGLSEKSVFIGGTLHYMLGQACDGSQIGEGCFLAHQHISTRGRVANIRIQPLGYFKNPAMGKALLEACDSSVIGNTGWYSAQETWLANFSEWGDATFNLLSFWTSFEKALRWHGLELKGKPFRIEKIGPKIRIPKMGSLSATDFSYYDETIIVPLDTWSTPFCGLVDR